MNRPAYKMLYQQTLERVEELQEKVRTLENERTVLKNSVQSQINVNTRSLATIGNLHRAGRIFVKHFGKLLEDYSYHNGDKYGWLGLSLVHPSDEAVLMKSLHDLEETLKSVYENEENKAWVSPS